MLYVNFAMTHYPESDASAQAMMPTLSYQRLQTEQPLSDVEVRERIRKTVQDKQEAAILEALLIFNKHVLHGKRKYEHRSQMRPSRAMGSAVLPKGRRS